MSGGLDLFGLFISNFDIGVIYDLGWYAAQQWMWLISGTLTALAIAIRVMEEKVAFLSTGQTNYVKMATNVFLVALALGLYFTIVHLVINFFNSIYGALNTSDSLMVLTTQLDRILGDLLEQDYEFSWTDIVDSFYAVFATITYAVTYALLVFMILAMRVAHAVLVTFCVFWGAVALPMSITTGLKSLQAFRSICILALIWPIVDAFFLYLVGGAFSLMLENSGLGMANIQTWNMGSLLFYMAAFSIINIFLAATTFSAPFVAQGLANNTGNVTGLIGSFGAAAIGAGVVSGKYLAHQFNAGGAKSGGFLKDQASKLTGKSNSNGNNSGLNAGMSSSQGMQGNASNSKANSGLASGGKLSSSNQQSTNSNTSQTTSSTSSNNIETAAGEKPSMDKATEAGEKNISNLQTPKVNIDPKSQLDTQQQNHQTLETPLESVSDEDNGMAREEKRKKQTKRGAIIQQNKRTTGKV